MISRFFDWLNSDSERRSVPREPGDGLVAFFWEGDTPRGHAVIDISRHGANLATGSISWSRGTHMILTLQIDPKLLTNGALPDAIVLQAEVLRTSPQGMALRFVFPTVKDRRTLLNFLSRWKSKRGSAGPTLKVAGAGA
jgi:hypothetical protein